MFIPKQLLCHLDDVPENEAKGFRVIQEGKHVDIFIVKRHNEIHSYKNSCPHTGVKLNWQPDNFMDYENTYIQCTIHGAKFEVESGLCVWGPCARQRLQKIDLLIENALIYF